MFYLFVFINHFVHFSYISLTLSLSLSSYIYLVHNLAKLDSFTGKKNFTCRDTNFIPCLKQTVLFYFFN